MYKSLLFLFLLYANSAYANIEEIINQLQPFFPSINAEQINESKKLTQRRKMRKAL